MTFYIYLGFKYSGFGLQIHPTFIRFALGWFVMALSRGQLEHVIGELNILVQDLASQNIVYQSIIQEKMKSDLADEDKMLQ